MLNRKIELSTDDGLITLTDQELDMIAAAALRVKVDGVALGRGATQTLEIKALETELGSELRVTYEATSGPTTGGTAGGA
jgi:hypothetical protein